MIRTRSVGVLLVALVVVLAGCTGATGVPGTATDGVSTTDDGTTDGGTTAAGASGTVDDRRAVQFYLSDERNDIDDFDHLNVTVTRVGLHRTGDEDGSGEWITREVDDVTVDLTRLQGARATRIASFDLPNGTYDKVFVYVSEVDGTLNGSGDSTRVKLPSGKLQLNEGFTIGDGESIDFVFDISVHKAGNSGKYILKPVIGESGTDVPIDDVDDDEKDEEKDGDEDEENGEHDERDEEEADDEAERELDVEFAGDPVRGGDATVVVTADGGPVKNAQVSIDGERVGKTDADGRLTITLPDADTVVVSVTAKGETERIELEFDE